MAKRLLAVSLFVVCAGVVFWFALVHTVHRGTLAVPDLGEQTIEDARKKLHDLGLELEIDEPGVYSTIVTPGAIAYQEPTPGFHVKSGSVVTVRVSLGGKTIEVPDILQTSLSAGQREIEQAGLTLGSRARVEGVGAADRVIATGPPGGQLVAPVTAVDILVNTSPHRPLWVMPSLVSQSLDRVERFCRLNRLRLGRAREVSYPGIASGLVLRQYPPAGSPVAPSDIITVWVSQ